MDELIITSCWRDKYKDLKEYYNKKYSTDYYHFDKYQLEIDPDEDKEVIEAYDAARQQQEIIKCCHSFPYFCQKYVKILHPMKGLVPFILYKYQTRVIAEYEKNRFNIISKFRQGGLTTLTLLWGMWRCLFDTDQQVMFLSKTDRDATDQGIIIDRAARELPEWMQPKKEGKWNDHWKQFPETGGSIRFHTPEAARGKAVTFLILDEAAFIPDMDKHWKAMWPTLSTGGSAAVVSTVNGLGNWYHKVFVGSQSKKGMGSKFNLIELDYVEHPDYNNKDWVEEQKAQLGFKGWQQEVLREFLGSGDTYFPADILVELYESTKDTPPLRKLMSRWSNKNEQESWEQGALWVWREPVDGHDYVFGVDVAEGMGEEADNSCFQVIDTSTLEQVAEFYSNEIPPHLFAQVLNEVGTYYNNALLVVEGQGPGGAVLSTLQHELFYENLYYEPKQGRKEVPGLKVNRVNRPLFLESLQNRLLNRTIRINSSRLVHELNTFNFSPVTKKAEAEKGCHDDAIMALCFGVYVRESFLRDIPMGAEVPKEVLATYNTEVYEEIKRELQDGAPHNFIEEMPDLLVPNKDDVLPGVVFNFKRKQDRLLREFGW